MRHTLLRLLIGAALLMPFVAVAQAPHPPGDCAGAYFLCDASRTVRIGQVPDAGLLPAELPNTRCADWPFPETNSAWFKWEIAQAGSLAFTLLPLRAGDDLDFVLFRLDAGLDDCGARGNALRPPERGLVMLQKSLSLIKDIGQIPPE